MKSVAKTYRFGPYELDLACYELRKRDRRVRLPASSMELLQVFVSRRGELVTREEIAMRLWSTPEAVDVTHGINTAVNRLRSVLGDDSAAPVYIETVIGKGYRFIAQVVQADSWVDTSAPRPAVENAPPLTAAPIVSEPPPTPPAPSRVWALSAVCLIVAAACAVFWAALRKPPSQLTPAAAAGDTQFLQVTYNSGDPITSAAISHDGRTIAYSDQSGVSVRAVGSAFDRLLPSPRSFRIGRLAWLPGDTRLLASGVPSATETPQVWTVSLDSQAPCLLFDDAAEATASPDGLRIACTRRGQTEIWLADVSGGHPRKLVAAGGADTFSSLLWAAQGSRLSYIRRRASDQPATEASPWAELQSQFQRAYESVESATGKLLDSQTNILFDSAWLLQDGRIFFPQNERPQEHPVARLFTTQTDPRTGRFLQPPRPALTFLGDSASQLSASDSGQEMAVVVQRRSPDVFVGALQPGPRLVNVRQLTHHSIDTYPHAWTPDSNAVLYETIDLGKFAIYQRKLDGSPPQLLARLPEHCILPRITPDGKWILFAEFTDSPKFRLNAIYRVPANGGKPQQVPTQGPFDEFTCPASKRGACVLRKTIGKQFVFYLLDPAAGKGKELGRTDWMPSILGDWSLSPDSSMVALANHDPLHPGIRVVTLSSPSKSPAVDIPVEGFGLVLDPTWSPDARGFYVESRTDLGYSLLFVDRSGHATVLRETPNPTWGVPSRDGKKLAFVDQSATSNVWLSQTDIR